MAPKPGVSLFGYALCMVTTGVFDVKSNIPPEWRPNLRQPFTAYAISSFFYTLVGTPSVEHVRGSGQPRPSSPARQRQVELRAASSLGGLGPMGSLGRDTAALQPRPRPDPRPPRAGTHLSIPAPRPTLSPPPRRRRPHAPPDISVPAGRAAWLA